MMTFFGKNAISLMWKMQLLLKRRRRKLGCRYYFQKLKNGEVSRWLQRADFFLISRA